MFKAGASFHDKNSVKKYLVEGMSPDQISQITRLRIEHVRAIIDQIKSGKLKLKGKLAYHPGEPGTHPLDGMTANQSESRMDELAAENKALNEKLDKLISMAASAPTETPVEPVQLEVDVSVAEDFEMAELNEAAEMAEIPDVVETAETEAPAPKKKKRRVAA